MRFTSLFLASFVSKAVLANPLLRQSLQAKSVAQKGSCSSCSYEQPTTVAPYKNIWQGLTDKEAVDVIELLHSDATGLNLTAAANATEYVLIKCRL